MTEIQLKRMEGLPAEAGIIRAVEIIRRKGISQISHVDPDLMGAACFQMDLKKSVPIFYGKALKMGYRGFSACEIYPPFYQRTGSTSYGSGNTSLKGRDPSDHGEVSPADLSCFHL